MTSQQATSLADLVGTKLRRGTQEVDTQQETQGKYVGLYFGAHWCPPCRAFTPVMRKFYVKGKPLEIIFVSADNSKQEFDDYYLNNMPWLAVPYEKSDLRAALSRRFKVLGIPTLAIIDSTGQVVNKNARAAMIKDPEGLQFPWVGQDDSTVGGGWWLYIVLAILALVYYFFVWGQE